MCYFLISNISFYAKLTIGDEQMKKINNSMVYIMMIFATFFWSGAFIAGKYAVGDFSPVTLTFLRFLFASIIIFVVLIKKQKDSWKLKKSDIVPVLVLGIMGMVGYHILFFTALKYASVSSTSILAATNPMITLIIACLIGQERINIKQIGIICLALLGVVLTITKWNIHTLIALDFNKGDLIMMCAVCCWATYAILVRKFVKNSTPLFLSAYSFIVCTVVLFPFALNEGLIEMAQSASTNAWIAVIYMSVFPTVLGYLIQQKAIEHIGPSKAAIFINLVPVFSIILSVLILKEDIYMLNMISSALIIVSVYMSTRLKN